MEHSSHSIIDRVRQLMPVRTLALLSRPLTRAEAETVAEQQATALLRLLSIKKPDVEIELVVELPGIDVVFVPDLPHSGTSDWVADDQGGYWLIAIKSSESLWRCRASLAHELKHILDDPFREILYPGWSRDQQPAPRRAERLSDYFAGCVLVPEVWLRQAWDAGYRSPSALAGLFVVSESMIQTRLVQTGLQPRWRRIPQVPEWHQYMRQGYRREGSALMATIEGRLISQFPQPQPAATAQLGSVESGRDMPGSAEPVRSVRRGAGDLNQPCSCNVHVRTDGIVRGFSPHLACLWSKFCRYGKPAIRMAMAYLCSHNRTVSAGEAGERRCGV